MTHTPRKTTHGALPARDNSSVTFSPLVGRIEQTPGGVPRCLLRRRGINSDAADTSLVVVSRQLPGGSRTDVHAVGDFSNHGAHWARQMNADQIARAEQHARNSG